MDKKICNGLANVRQNLKNFFDILQWLTSPKILRIWSRIFYYTILWGCTFLHQFFYTMFVWFFLHQFFDFFTPIFWFFYTNFCFLLHQYFVFFTSIFYTIFFPKNLFLNFKIWCKKSKIFGEKKLYYHIVLSISLFAILLIIFLRQLYIIDKIGPNLDHFWNKLVKILKSGNLKIIIWKLQEITNIKKKVLIN